MLDLLTDSQKCVDNLKQFVNNKLYTTNLEQKFGYINRYRQTLL